jgi:hypothetical protein
MRPRDGSKPVVVGVAAIVAVLFLVVAVGWTIAGTTGTTEVAASSGPSTPPVTVQDWDPRLAPLARFVEETRGKPFLRPVPVEFLADDEFEATLLGEGGEPTEEDLALLDASTVQLRALGLIGSDVDLRSLSEQIVGGGTLAYYDSEAERIVVRGQELDPFARAVVVHELTHAWQDQYTDLDRIDTLDDVLSATLRGVAEGDASVVEQAYVDELSAREQRDYDEKQEEIGRGATDELTGIPDVLQASFVSPYVIGPGFVGVLLAEGGNAAVDGALEDPPPGDIDLILPQRYLQRTQPVDVEPPAVLPGQELVDQSEFGALSLLLTLSQRIDPRRAIEAVDGWAGDDSTTYRQDGRSCVALAVAGVDPASTDRLATAMGEWAAGGPIGAASVERVGDEAVLRACDAPELVVSTSEGGSTALAYVALRLTVFGQVVDQLRLPVDQAACFADHVVDRVTPEELADGSAVSTEQGQQRGADAAAACIN